MPKVKNWEKVKDNKLKEQWKHSSGRKVTLLKRKGDNRWTVNMPTGYRGARFKNKDEGRKFAVDWMENHTSF